MHQGLRISVVIPCYNEAEGLRRLLARVPRCVDERIVVDNGSVDGTASVARTFGVVVIEEAKRGVGYAYQRGLARATGDLIVGQPAASSSSNKPGVRPL